MNTIDLKKLSNKIARFGCKNAKISVEYDIDMGSIVYEFTVMTDWLKWHRITAEHIAVFESKIDHYLLNNYKHPKVEPI